MSTVLSSLVIVILSRRSSHSSWWLFETSGGFSSSKGLRRLFDIREVLRVAVGEVIGKKFRERCAADAVFGRIGTLASAADDVAASFDRAPLVGRLLVGLLDPCDPVPLALCMPPYGGPVAGLFSPKR